MEHYKLPDLTYKYDALSPHMSEEVLKLHHGKHHAGYVKSANDLLDKLAEARKNNADLDFKSVLRSLSFNVGGHMLHEIFWSVMVSPAEAKAKEGQAKEIIEAINKEFGNIERFKKEFSETAKSVEGSGWATLTYDKNHSNLNIIQIEKHNLNLYPNQKILLCLDVWEHSYYLDYKNDRAKFVENWWDIVNWQEVNKRYKES